MTSSLLTPLPNFVYRCVRWCWQEGSRAGGGSSVDCVGFAQGAEVLDDQAAELVEVTHGVHSERFGGFYKCCFRQLIHPANGCIHSTPLPKVPVRAPICDPLMAGHGRTRREFLAGSVEDVSGSSNECITVSCCFI